uniref:Cytokine-like nuclear factor N-PAC n=1 Tax=Lygus hesperus TaxID=30085 RepID=A0A0A9XU16_LYGHE
MTTFKIGDLVWAKMKGFPKWPGVVAEPTKELKVTKKANNFCIFFFGTNNFAWIEPKGLEAYSEPADSKKKSGAFKDALAAIEHYKLTGEGGPPVEGETTDPFDQLIRPSASVPNLQSDKKVKTASAKKRRISKDDSQAASSEEDASSEDGVAPRSGKAIKLKGPKKSTDITPKGRPPRSSNASSLIKRKKKAENYAADTTTGEASTSRKSLLDRPPVLPRAETPPLDLHTVSHTLLSKSVIPSDKVFGFIGLGIMGSGIVKNLLNSGHEVHVWDRSPEKSQEFARIGAKLQMTPSDVVGSADITFSCVSDPTAAKELVFGNCGVLREMNVSKAFVEMSGIDPDTSMTIATAIHEYGGRYLESMLVGSKAEADEGTLILLAAGDRTLFNDVSSCFEATGRASIFLGEVGSATKMNLIHQMYMGTTMACMAEAMALADRAGLNQAEVLEILGISNVCSPLLMDKGKAITDCTFATKFSLKNLSKDMKLVQGLSETLDQPIPITSAANEVFKHARRFGYGDHDAAAVYISARF